MGTTAATEFAFKVSKLCEYIISLFYKILQNVAHQPEVFLKPNLTYKFDFYAFIEHECNEKLKCWVFFFIYLAIAQAPLPTVMKKDH